MRFGISSPADISHARALWVPCDYSFWRWAVSKVAFSLFLLDWLHCRQGPHPLTWFFCAGWALAKPLRCMQLHTSCSGSRSICLGPTVHWDLCQLLCPQLGRRAGPLSPRAGLRSAAFVLQPPLPADVPLHFFNQDVILFLLYLSSLQSWCIFSPCKPWDIFS